MVTDAEIAQDVTNTPESSELLSASGHHCRGHSSVLSRWLSADMYESVTWGQDEGEGMESCWQAWIFSQISF